MDNKEQLPEFKKVTGINEDVMIIRKIGRLKNLIVSKASDVLGFDNIIYSNDTCYEYYAANPPLIGMTQPVPVPYPIGLATFKTYKIDYKEAVEIFHRGNWGSKFTSIVLSKPLYPGVNDPSWYMISELGVHVIINANTGEAHTNNIKDEMLVKA